jgi:hypothetical protein
MSDGVSGLGGSSLSVIYSKSPPMPANLNPAKRAEMTPEQIAAQQERFRSYSETVARIWQSGRTWTVRNTNA